MYKQGFWRKILDGLRSPAHYVSWAVLVAVLTFAAPFQQYLDLNASGRGLFWAAVVALAILWGMFLRIGLQHRFPSLPRGRAIVLGAAISAAVLACPIRCLAIPLTPDHGASIPDLAWFAALIFSSGLGVGALRVAFEAQDPIAEAPPDVARISAPAGPEVPRQAPRLLSRLPEQIRAPLVRLSVRDHYVHVHTSAGVHQILLRLSDAIAETEGVDGLRVHRSHWVARDAIAAVNCSAGRAELVMTDGAAIPVSRTYLDTVRSIGPEAGQ